jgi:hypothetical protein
MGDRHKHNHAQLPGQRNLLHMREVEEEVQVLAYEESVVVEDAAEVGTFAYIFCHCMANWEKSEQPRRLCYV